MKKTKWFLWLVVIFTLRPAGWSLQDVPFTTGSWDEEAFGNHRAVIHVAEPAPAVRVSIPWRRRDFNPQDKKIIVTDAATGIHIKNVIRVNISRESGTLIFQPRTVPGDYYVYYLVNEMTGRSNYPTVVYPEPEYTADAEWLEKYGLKNEVSLPVASRLPEAEVKAIQSIDEFNSFFPMEVIATGEETRRLLDNYPDASFLCFPEDRSYPIRMSYDLPHRWIQSGPETTLSGRSFRGEFYAFQIGLFACRREIRDLKVEFSGLKNESSQIVISPDLFTCFNTGGTDWTGQSFKKTCSVEKGMIKALWCGLDIPSDIKPGYYSGSVHIHPEGLESRSVTFEIRITDEARKDKGDDEPWRHSRLRWLNSTIALNDDVISPYAPMRIEDRTISCLGRDVVIGPMGLPSAIRSFFNPEITGISSKPSEILDGPIRLVVESSQDVLAWHQKQTRILNAASGAVTWESSGKAGPVDLDIKARMEFNGHIDFKIRLTSRESINIRDIRLEVPVSMNAAKYIMGMGIKGGIRADEFHWKWDQEKNQDSVWVGDINAGLQVSFRDERYSRPLNTNFYLLKPLVLPRSWWNEGKGGCDIFEQDKSLIIRSYSGSRKMNRETELYFNFSVLITPFRPLNTAKHWKNRYFHRYEALDKIKSTGANVVNIHHATPINPFINYPFHRTKEMKAYVEKAHAKDMKVKIYYTVRELTNRAPELFALRSLGDEILSYGPGGGFSWLQEHLIHNYIAGWFVPELKDAAVINSGVSRWHNYYLEGLNWLVKNIGIDGLYIDDVAFDRTVMKRVRRILDRHRPGALIDLHSANQFNIRDGFANSANLYLEHFPYIDRLWFGEYFDYDASPDYWLIEVSGIPFGLMGEMLQNGGNPWRGMLYGMTSRLPWAGDPTPIWQLWDRFGIEESEMIGYWSTNCPVNTGNDNVPATVYKRDKTSLIALSSWANKKVNIALNADWEALGIDPEQAVFTAPYIENFQEKNQFKPGEEIPVHPGKGWLLICEEKRQPAL